MRMGNSSLADTTAGQVVNLLSNDMQRFDLTFAFLHYGWIIPLQVAVVIYLAYSQAGVSAFFAFVTLLIFVLPIQG